ncbi:MAG: hypothetical protein B7Y39_09470 [Bdellovibrio sp. 28-41-41]|nr:MAG: hypothetical protein B7Y39_09470 [Bdellovibrio sp. 28-41-41]
MIQLVKIKILFFDGYCSLCNGLVDWTMRQDKHARIQFASLQGKTAKTVIPNNNINDTDTVVYWRDGKSYQRSSAILYLLADIGGAWSLFGIFFLIPTVLRDFLYRIVAVNRYRFFNRRDSCRMSTLQEKDRLLP